MSARARSLLSRGLAKNCRGLKLTEISASVEGACLVDRARVLLISGLLGTLNHGASRAALMQGRTRGGCDNDEDDDALHLRRALFMDWANFASQDSTHLLTG